MPIYKLQEYRDVGVLPVDAVVGLEVSEINPKTVSGKNGRSDWTKLEFKFLIDSVPTSLEADFGDLVGTPIWGAVNEQFTEHPDNKLRQWAEALLDIGELPAGFELDTDMLIGRKARGVVTQYDKRDGTKAHQIMGLLPLTSTLPAQPAAPVAAVSVQDDDPPF